PTCLVSALPLLSAVPTTRNREGHFTEISRSQSEVHRRALGGTMAQDVTDGLQRSSILEKTQGIGVAQAMWALVAEPAFANQRLKGFRDGCGFQHAQWRAHTQENSAIGCRRWCSFQMLHERGQDLISERQFQWRGSLTLMNAQNAVPPTDVLKTDGNDLAG